MVEVKAAPGGLRNVAVAESRVSSIDGARGVLAYRGIDIHELAEHSTFAETTYLLHEGVLPTRERSVRRVHVSDGVRPNRWEARIVAAGGNGSVDEVHASRAGIIGARSETEDPFAHCQAAGQMNAEHRSYCVTMPGHDSRL